MAGIHLDGHIPNTCVLCGCRQEVDDAWLRVGVEMPLCVACDAALRFTGCGHDACQEAVHADAECIPMETT